MRHHDRDRRGPRRGGLVRMGVRGISGGIGLISESIKARKESKASSSAGEGDQGSTSRTHSEAGQDLDRENDAFDGPPPSYSPALESEGHDQYPEEKAGPSQDPDEKAGPSQYPDEKAGHSIHSDGKAEHEQDSEQDDGSEPEDNLEDEWNLDDAQDGIIGEPPEKDPDPDTRDLEDKFIRDHPPPGYTEHESAGRLPLPVIIPQRRPKDRSRGFIRAYAPVLENCGIDQATWLGFLDTFQKSSAASPWLNCINFASIGTMFIASHPIGIVAGYAIQQVTNMAIELQGRQRTTNFLQKINEEFFRPRGLYCLVMTWNPESSQRVEQVNLTSTIASRSKPNTGLMGVPSKFRSSDGNTYGEWEFPETAPLIFPALDQMAAQTSADGVKEKTKFAKGYTFVANYWDKRATAEYAMTNPDSVLAKVPQGKFNSRYADPNNPAARGSLISFVSGGHLVPNPESRGLIGGLFNVAGQAMRGETQGSGWNQQANAQQNYQYNNQQQYGDPQYHNQYSRHYRGRRRRERRNRNGPVGGFKKLLKKNVLYLMVVNMPSDEEMAAAKAAFPQ